MKRIYLFLTAILLAVFAVPAMAQTGQLADNATDGIYYVIQNGSAYVATRNSHGSNGHSSGWFSRSSEAPTKLDKDANGNPTGHDGTNPYVGIISVPATVTIGGKKYDVVGLDKGNDGSGSGDQYGAGTFQYSGITSVTLPATITDIQQAAFADCPFLMNIFVDENNTKYMSIEGVVYEYTVVDGVKTPTKLVAVPGGKTSVRIPETVTEFVICAMDGCTNIKELAISSNTLNSIGDYAFADMTLDKLTIYSNKVPAVANTNAFTDCDIAAIYVQKDLVDKYKAATGWTKYRDVIYAIEKNVVAGTFTVNIKLAAQNYDSDDQVFQIAEIKVTGSDSETFDTSVEIKGWTLTAPGEDENTYNTHIVNADGSSVKAVYSDDKTITITVDEAFKVKGVYTLNIPANSLKTMPVEEDGNLVVKECDMAQATWQINQKIVNNPSVEKVLTIVLNDSEDNFSWSYTNDEGVTVKRSETHIVGNTLYIKDHIAVNGNTTTITPTVYKSANAEYKRTFKNNKWQALYVPFDMVYNPAWAGSFEIAKITGVFETLDKDNNVVWFYVVGETVESGTIPANTPCVIRSLQADNTEVLRTIALTSGSRIEASDKQHLEISGNKGNKYRFTGQYTKTGITDDDKTYAMAGGALKQPTQDTTVSLGAYRWYLEINPSDENATATFSFGRFENEGTTGIEEVTTENVTVKGIYDLQGRKIDEITKPGLYIVDGVKVLVK